MARAKFRVRPTISIHDSYSLTSLPPLPSAVPFQIAPQRGLHISETAAHSVFGVTYVLRLLLARFFKRFFGIDKEAYGGFFDTGVKKVAFTPLLLPMWKVDLAMKGKALLDQAELSLSSESRFPSVWLRSSTSPMQATAHRRR